MILEKTTTTTTTTTRTGLKIVNFRCLDDSKRKGKEKREQEYSIWRWLWEITTRHILSVQQIGRVVCTDNVSSWCVCVCVSSRSPHPTKYSNYTQRWQQQQQGPGSCLIYIKEKCTWKKKTHTQEYGKKMNI